MRINISDYNYELPEDRIAKFPLESRDSSKLLIYNQGKISHRIFSELPEMLNQDILLVKNELGYRNLSRLISTARLKGGHLKFKCTFSDLRKYNEGLIALSGGLKGKITQLLKQRDLEREQ